MKSISKTISNYIFNKKNIIIILSIWFVLEFIHFFIKKYESGFYLKLDDYINILTYFCSSLFTLLIIILFIKNNAKIPRIGARISIIVTVYYLLFLGFGYIIIKITEGTQAGQGPLWDFPFVGPIFYVNTFVAVFTAYLVLPIGIFLSLYMLIKNHSKILMLLSLITCTVLLIFSGKLVGFILD